MAFSLLRAATLLLLLVLPLSPLLSSAQEATPSPAPAPTAGGDLEVATSGRAEMSGWKTARAVLLTFVAAGVVGLAVIYWRKRRARHAADSSSRLELV
jgi:hypothetical protein